MSWYRTGTISLTNGSAAITGSGTDFIAGAAIGEGVLAPDGKVYEIASIASATSLTLGSNYLGSNASGQSYAIVPTQSYIRDLAAQAASMVNTYSAVVTGPGAGKFADGTVGVPSIRFVTDDDTGINHASANSLDLVTGGVSQATISSANGFVALVLKVKNAANTFTNWLTSATTAARTWTMPDKDGTVAMTSDITGTNSNTNTGDETAATIKSKLAITTLSGSNTGDQTNITGNAATATNVAVGGITGLGTGVAAALAVNVGSAGAPVVNGGALGTPSSGTVTNLTGTASININGTVGATTPAAGSFTTLSASGLVSVSPAGLQSAGSADLVLEARASGAGVCFIQGTNVYIRQGSGGAYANMAIFSSTGLAVTGGISSTGLLSLSVTGASSIGFNGGSDSYTLSYAGTKLSIGANNSFSAVAASLGYLAAVSGSNGAGQNHLAISPGSSTGGIFFTSDGVGTAEVMTGKNSAGSTTFSLNTATGALSASGDISVAGTGAKKIKIESTDGTSAAIEFVRTGAGGDFRIKNASGYLDTEYGIDDTSFGTLVSRLTSTGSLQVTNVLDLSGAAAGQIKFPATQNASADPNTFDDYKEATWTPIDGSGAGLTFTLADCNLTKVGRVITATASVTYPATADTRNVSIGGFTSAIGIIACNISYCDAAVATATYLNGSGTVCSVFIPGFSVSNASMSGKTIIFSATYFV